MRYDPRAVTEHDRSYSYSLLWLGLPFSIGLFASLQFAALSFLSVLLGGFVSGTLMALGWAWSHDEFVRGQIAFAANCALSVVGFVLFAQLVPYAREWEPDTGLVLAGIALVFHAALAFRRWKDK